MKRSKIVLYRGDIIKLRCDAIVNAANKTLLGGGGVDGAIHKGAGPELLEECRKLKWCDTGDAKLTKGYNLNSNYVIHTVGPIYSGEEKNSIELASCYKNSLSLAKKINIHSIAFPAISTGAYGYPIKEACEIAVRTIKIWIAENKDYDIEIFLSSFNEEIYKELKTILGE